MRHIVHYSGASQWCIAVVHDSLLTHTYSLRSWVGLESNPAVMTRYAQRRGQHVDSVTGSAVLGAPSWARRSSPHPCLLGLAPLALGGAPRCAAEEPPCPNHAYGCSLCSIRLQPELHTVAASTAYGCSLNYIRQAGRGRELGLLRLCWPRGGGAAQRAAAVRRLYLPLPLQASSQ